MTGISKQGCIKLARHHGSELVRARKSNQWGMVLHSRLMRDSYMADARAQGPRKTIVKPAFKRAGLSKVTRFIKDLRIHGKRPGTPKPSTAGPRT